MSENKIPYKIYLEENEMPKAWYNVRADMKNKPAPLLNPGTLQPMTAQELGVDTAQVGLKGSATKVTATSRPPVRGQCRRLTGTLEEMAQAVAQALRGKEAEIHD
mgnify:CR=1 FL=1